MKYNILTSAVGTVSIVFSLFLLNGCIENDIPYPYVEGEITSVEVEGMNGSPEIKKATRSIVIEVNDQVDTHNLRITKLQVANNASIFPDSAKCINSSVFPEKGFASLDSISPACDTRVNFSTPVSFLLKTYQDYSWTITVNQLFERKTNISGQVGKPVFDVKNKQVVIYVAASQSLKNITVNEMQLGSSIAQTKPDPMSVKDFSRPVSFDVTAFGRKETWIVNVLYVNDTQPVGKAFPWTKQAILTGDIQSGATVEVEYKKEDESNWQKLASKGIVVNGTTFTATITGLEPSTSYICRSIVNGITGTDQKFATASAPKLNNGSFDEWSLDSKNAKLWYPWSANGASFWDTGNKGATLVGGSSNSAPSDETSTGSGKAAKLESKYVLVKFAAGNIFSGTFVNIDGTDGILSFGRPFTSFPTNLKIHYKYTSKAIDRVNEKTYPEYAGLKGRPDSCFIYVALTDWDAPREIRTKPTNRQLFDKNDKNIIAYAEFVSGETTDKYKELNLKLNYRYLNRTPKYIVVVASSSKYGDYFTGGEGSTLWIDDFELTYE